MNSARNEDGEEVEEHAFVGGQFEGICRNCGQIEHKLFQCKNHSNHNGANNSNTTAGRYYTYCRKADHIKPNCLKLKKKETR
jgi:bisphosphoglycerate-independent phosphoglycerate mutase (AlkP superfamily)